MVLEVVKDNCARKGVHSIRAASAGVTLFWWFLRDGLTGSISLQLGALGLRRRLLLLQA